MSDSTAGLTRDGVVRLQLPEGLLAGGAPVGTVTVTDPDVVGTGNLPPRLDDNPAVAFWLRAYPIGSFTFLDMEPAIPPVWTQGSLAWIVYDLPAGRFAVNIGLSVGSDFGGPTPLAYVP